MTARRARGWPRLGLIPATPSAIPLLLGVDSLSSLLSLPLSIFLLVPGYFLSAYAPIAFQRETHDIDTPKDARRDVIYTARTGVRSGDSSRHLEI